MEIIKQLKESNLTGLGGAGFPTWQKWQAVLDAPEKKRFVICNLSEGEPGVFKDEYIINHHLKELILGIELAAETISAPKSYIYLNDKFKKYLPKIKRLASPAKIEIFINTGRYLCGEETTLLQVLEGKIRWPRIRPPFPAESGLYGYPTLINNAETLYRAHLVSIGKYQPKRFYSVSGEKIKKEIVEANVDAKISEIIGKKNLGQAKFARIGGVTGEFLPKEKFDQPAGSTGAIELYPDRKEIISALIESIKFLKSESCGKCTPCREGLYRVAENFNRLFDSGSLWDRKDIVNTIKEISDGARESSFCPLGKSIWRLIESALENFSEELLS
ncbi:MAG: hypothetical protein NTW79_00490 [Candidatus Berkelbacteria bacterium]|nr:hypothetical protein [Candidatus Berkelbacteria bacterium]